MKIRTFLAAAAAAAIIGGALPARACLFDPQDAQEDIDKADVIFTGSVNGIQHIAADHNLDGPEYRTMFDADKIFKGRVTPDAAVKVTQTHDTWAHYIHFKTGKKYLVLAVRSRYGFGLVVDGCSPVMSLDPADVRSDEPGPEYKDMVARALGDDTLFPALTPVARDGARRRLEQENKEDSGKGGY